MASRAVRLAEDWATEVPVLMSFKRVMEEVSRGPMSRMSRRGEDGKEATVLFRETVAFEIVVIAAIIEAPSARALVVRRRRRRWRSERCILILSESCLEMR
jgi:hypothetical protein